MAQGKYALKGRKGKKEWAEGGREEGRKQGSKENVLINTLCKISYIWGMLISYLQAFLPHPPQPPLREPHCPDNQVSRVGKHSSFKKSGFYQPLSWRNKHDSLAVSKHDFKITDENVRREGWGWGKKGMRSKDKENSELSECRRGFSKQRLSMKLLKFTQERLHPAQFLQRALPVQKAPALTAASH